jgi:hypothetical protein
MERIASFEQFKNSEKHEIVNNEIVLAVTNESNNDDRKHYMFFRNLATIKHHVDEILKMDPDKVDELLNNGHDWASDHIATSKDDVQEVSEWLIGEFDDPTESDDEEDEVETEEDETEEDEVETEEDETEEDEEDEEEDEEEVETGEETTKQQL